MTTNAIDKAIAALENIATLTEKDPRDSVIKYHADQALTELKAARQSGVPDGYVMVPKEPPNDGLSHAALSAGFTVLSGKDKECVITVPQLRKLYRAMIAAARDGRD